MNEQIHELSKVEPSMRCIENAPKHAQSSVIGRHAVRKTKL